LTLHTCSSGLGCHVGFVVWLRCSGGAPSASIRGWLRGLVTGGTRIAGSPAQCGEKAGKIWKTGGRVKRWQLSGSWALLSALRYHGLTLGTAAVLGCVVVQTDVQKGDLLVSRGTGRSWSRGAHTADAGCGRSFRKARYDQRGSGVRLGSLFGRLSSESELSKYRQRPATFIGKLGSAVNRPEPESVVIDKTSNVSRRPQADGQTAPSLKVKLCRNAG